MRDRVRIYVGAVNQGCIVLVWPTLLNCTPCDLLSWHDVLIVLILLPDVTALPFLKGKSVLAVQDIDLPTMPGAEASSAAATVFAAPTPGMSPPQRWLNKCSLAAEHVAAGDFASAMGLLNRSAVLSHAHVT